MSCSPRYQFHESCDHIALACYWLHCAVHGAGPHKYFWMDSNIFEHSLGSQHWEPSAAQDLQEKGFCHPPELHSWLNLASLRQELKSLDFDAVLGCYGWSSALTDRRNGHSKQNCQKPFCWLETDRSLSLHGSSTNTELDTYKWQTIQVVLFFFPQYEGHLLTHVTEKPRSWIVFRYGWIKRLSSCPVLVSLYFFIWLFSRWFHFLATCVVRWPQKSLPCSGPEWKNEICLGLSFTDSTSMTMCSPLNQSVGSDRWEVNILA